MVYNRRKSVASNRKYFVQVDNDPFRLEHEWYLASKVAN